MSRPVHLFCKDRPFARAFRQIFLVKPAKLIPVRRIPDIVPKRWAFCQYKFRWKRVGNRTQVLGTPSCRRVHRTSAQGILQAGRWETILIPIIQSTVIGQAAIGLIWETDHEIVVGIFKLSVRLEQPDTIPTVAE